ncbi:MAG: 2-dehydropantoate 2-reductase [Planctomycetes bacterium]|nr:2-dehydropantoate 2-reductase [Planctomycetota bacterium]
MAEVRPRTFQHVVIVGPGAVGLCVAVHLAGTDGGPRVTLVDHDAGRAARLSARPLRLRTEGGILEARVPVRLAPDEPPDLVILATKAHQAGRAVAAAAAWIGRAPLVTLQNGLGVTEEVAAALPRTGVITGVTYQAANVVAEGEVHHAANVLTHLGYLAGPADAVAEAVADLFARAGLPARVEADMTPVVWWKLLINAAINPVAALAGVRNGEVAHRPTLAALVSALADEGQAVARAEGVRLPGEDAAAAALQTARATAANRCSMLQDLDAGRPTEVEYLNGAIVRLAAARGVSVPTHRAAAALVRQVSSASAA